jgi:ferredoxin
MKVKTDTGKCSGHAQCAANGPDLFELNDDGYVLPMDNDVPAHLEEQARAGASACPERAIEIIE